MSKLISEFKIGFDDETKAEIAALKGKLDEVARGLLAKKDSHADGLLAAMQAEAANDDQPGRRIICSRQNGKTTEHEGWAASSKLELKEMGQWVFEGQDEEWQSAAVDKDGYGYLYSCDKSILRRCGLGTTHKGDFDTYLKPIGANFDTSDWKNSAIDRETVNDVDYLSDDDLNDSVPHIDDVLAQPNWLSDSVPQITQDDLQLIFIKNLSNVLIQRMQTMERFSEDDYAIGGDKLMAWDIVFDNSSSQFGVISGCSLDKSVFSLFFFGAFKQDTRLASCFYRTANELSASKIHTITEALLPAFREALETCYA